MGVVERVLAGEELERPDGHAILNCPDERLAELLAATLQVREAAFGRRVKVASCATRKAVSVRKIAATARSRGFRAPTFRYTTVSYTHLTLPTICSV